MVQTFDSGEVLEHPPLNNMIRAMNGDGVLSGFAVTQRASGGANMSVDVALGEAWIDSAAESEAGLVNVVIDAADANDERKDLIIYDASANKPDVIKGTNHAGTDLDPTYPPDIPVGDILLAIVKVDINTLTIVDSDITDCRINVTRPKIHSTRASDTLKDSDDSIEGITTDGYLKIKELGPVPAGILMGTLRIKFAMNDTGVGTSYGQIRRNGAAIGTEQSTVDIAYTTYSEDIGDWMGGDTIELWVKNNQGVGNGNVKEFRVYCDNVYVQPVDTVTW